MSADDPIRGKLTRDKFFEEVVLDNQAEPPKNPVKVGDLGVCEYSGGPPVYDYLKPFEENSGEAGAFRLVIKKGDGFSVVHALPLTKGSDPYLASPPKDAEGDQYSDPLPDEVARYFAARTGRDGTLKYFVPQGSLAPRPVKLEACRSQSVDPTTGQYRVFVREKNVILDNECRGKMMVKTDNKLHLPGGDVLRLVNVGALAEEQYCVKPSTTGKKDWYQFYLKPDWTTGKQVETAIEDDKSVVFTTPESTIIAGINDALFWERWQGYALIIGVVAGITGVFGGVVAILSVKIMNDMNKVAKLQAQSLAEATGKGKKRGSILAKGENLTEKAKRGEIDDVVGAKEEDNIREAKAAMEKGNNASALFDGEKGDGKSATQDAIALRAARGDWGPEWQKVEFIRLNKRTLIGDGEFNMKMFGELEAMSKQLFDEVIQRYEEGRPVVLVLDETHWLVLLMDKPDILVGDWKEEMAERARFRILGGSTPNPDELPRAKQANGAFFDRFQIIERKPKNRDDIVEILRAKVGKLAKRTGVSVSGDLLTDIADISFRREGRHSPRKAIGLMEMLMIRKAQANQGARNIRLESGDVYREIDKAAEIELAKTAQDRFGSESAHALLRERYLEEIRDVLRSQFPDYDRWSPQARQIVETPIIEGWMSQSDVRESYERTGKGIEGFTSEMVSGMSPEFTAALLGAAQGTTNSPAGGVDRPDREVMAEELAKKIPTFAGWSPVARADLMDQLVEVWTTNPDVKQRYLHLGDQAIPSFVSELIGRIPANTLREYRGTAVRESVLPQRLRERAMEEAVVFGLASRAAGFGDTNGETQGQIIAEALVKAESESLFVKGDRASLRSDLDKCMVLVDQVVAERKAADTNAVRLRDEKETEKRRKREVPAIFI